MDADDTPTGCRKCGQFMLFPKSHKCPPIWRCVVDDHGYTLERDGHDVRARDAEEAAEKYADEYDEEDRYMIRRDTTITVIVESADGKKTRWSVCGEAVPTYSATEID